MSDRPVVPEPSDAVESAAGPASAGSDAVAGVAGVVVLGVSEARNRLYELVDAARDDGQVVVIEKRDAKARHTYRAALVPVGRLDAASRAKLVGWPSWARTAARPKLGDRVIDAAGPPGERGVPQVLLDRTTPLAVLVEAELLPPGDALVTVPEPAGPASDVAAEAGAEISGVRSGPDAGVEPRPSGPRWAGTWPMSFTRVSDVLSRSEVAAGAAAGPAVSAEPSETASAAAAVADEADVANGGVAGGAAPGNTADPQGAGAGSAGPDLVVAGRDGGADSAGDAAAHDAAGAEEVVTGLDAGRAAAPAAEAAPTPAAVAALPVGGRLHRLHGLGEVAGLALTEAVEPPAVPRFGFGLHALDTALGSLPSGVLTVVAAEPHAGGSLLAVHAARHTALTRRLPVLYAASGLSRADVAMRVVAAEGGLDYRRLRTGDLTADERQAAAVVQARLAAADLHVDDGTGLTAELIAETAPYVEGLALVVVDRFQHAADRFIPLSGPALAEAARVLAHLARTRKVPVVVVLDTADPGVLAGLDAAYLTLILTRTGNDAHVVVAERDFGELTTVPLRADLACARFTDLLGSAVAHVPGGAAVASAGPVPGMPGAAAGAVAGVSGASEGTAAAAGPGVALQPAAAGQEAPAAADATAVVGAGVAVAEVELLDAALPFTSGARQGLSARLNGVLAALREASTTPGRAGELPGLREILDGLALRRPPVPSTPEGERLGAALAAFTAARRVAPSGAPAVASAVSAGPQQASASGMAEAGPTPTPAPGPAETPDLAVVEAELLAAAVPFLTGNEHRSPLSVQGQHVLTALRDALAPGNEHLLPVLPAARARVVELGARRLRLPATFEAGRLRAALTAYHVAATAAGITPSALPAPGRDGVTGSVRPVTPAQVPATASVTVTEPASAAESAAAAEAAGAAPGDAEEAQGAGPARRVVEGVVMEAPSASFRDDTPPPEGTPGTGGRNYTFFLNKIRDAVEQALGEANGDVDAAIAALKKKAVPDSMALFKLTRVGANYVHTVYPPALDFLSKPGQGEADGVWEGRQKWRNAPLYEAIRKGERHPLDVFGLDINAAYLSAFKTHLPIGALKHDPTGGFDRRKAGIHRVDHFTWPHADLPSPIGNRIEPGPYLLDEATVRLLIRCSELGLSEPPRILESWTSGASEALLEKFRRVLQQARQTAIDTGDPVTGEYVKAMYSRFTSTIGESGKNRELRRPEWVHTIRSQAFASLWLRGWKAHQAGLILVQVSGVDELHVAGGDWKKVWEEGRKPTQMKVKRLYTLGGN
jgi:hypothetical protein